MGNYSIKDLEVLSGIKSHTIRIWEQRYSILKPERTETNIRLYGDNELKKILNISLLIKAGYKISKISKLNKKELNIELETLLATEVHDEIQFMALITQLILSGLKYDEFLFEKTFSSSILLFGLKDTCEKILYPMLVKIGHMWSTNKIIPAQEHFISNMVKQKLFTAIDALPAPRNEAKAKVWLLFLPEHEEHEIGLLIANFLIREAGNKVIYLGQRVPFQNIKYAADHCKPDFIYTFFTTSIAQNWFTDYLIKLKKTFRKENIVVSANARITEKNYKNKSIYYINNIDQLISLIS